MRSFFKFLPLGLLVVIIAARIYAQNLPEDFAVERRLEMEVSRDQAFAQVASIKNWQNWYVDKDAGPRISGPEVGKGGKLTIKDQESNEDRSVEIVSTSSTGPTAVVEYHLPHAQADTLKLKCTFSFEALSENKTLVISRQEAKATDLPTKFYGHVFANDVIGSMLMRELHNLKGELEGLPKPINRPQAPQK